MADKILFGPVCVSWFIWPCVCQWATTVFQHDGISLNSRHVSTHLIHCMCLQMACLGSSAGFSIMLQCASAVWPSRCGGPRFKFRVLWLVGTCKLIGVYSLEAFFAMMRYINW